MQLDPDWIAAQGADGALLHWVDTALAIKTPDRIGVAVSGGGDSMALLHLFWRWAAQTGVPIYVVTVNHGLRAEAVEEVALVAAFCANLGIDHAVLDWNNPPDGGNLMAQARTARYRLIADWAKGKGIGLVALGHTADDIAETFLMRLGRRSGVDGLSMMQPRFDRHGLSWARPLWQVQRAVLRSYLTRHGIDWAEDPTNVDPQYDRSRARQALGTLATLGIDVEGLTDVAHQMFMARDALHHYTVKEARRLIRIEAGDLILTRRPNPPVPAEIERRLLIAAIRWVGGLDYPPRSNAMVNLETGLTQNGRHTLGGCLIRLEQDGQNMRIAREHGSVAELRTPTTAIWDHRWQMNGPHGPDLHVGALGEAITECPDWRKTGLPRTSLMASPAVFRGSALISAPLAGHQNGWEAQIVAPFTEFLLSR